MPFPHHYGKIAVCFYTRKKTNDKTEKQIRENLETREKDD